MSHGNNGTEVSAEVIEKLSLLIEDDAQIAASLPDSMLMEELENSDLHFLYKMQAVFTRYAHRLAWGERSCTYITSGAGEEEQTQRELLPEFTHYTYTDVWHKIQLCGSWLQTHGFLSSQMVMSLGFTSLQYSVLDFATAYAGLTFVPIQTSSTPEQIQPIMAETQPVIFAVSSQYMMDVLDILMDQSSLRAVIIFDYHPQVTAEKAQYTHLRQRLSNAGIDVYVLEEIIESQKSRELYPFVQPESAEQVYRIIYTSGSTGTPKGAIYTTEVMNLIWSATSEIPILMVHYMPMSHNYGFTYIIISLIAGGLSYFTARSDQSTLIEDNSLLRPTVFNAVPRIFDLFFHMYNSQYSALTQNVTDETEKRACAQEVKRLIRVDRMGGRLLMIVCASAPLAPDMRDFIADLFQLPIIDAYGTTETQIVMRNGVLLTKNVLEHKLVDVPELGYYTSDKPYPRGELLLRVKGIFGGYYRREDITQTVFDDQGFYRTGDVMEETSPGVLRYVDRRNNVLKLAQGEFVTIAQLEAYYATSNVIAQIYIYGRSDQAYLLAVVVPIPQLCAQYEAGECEQVKNLIMESLQTIGKEKQLNSYEIPRDIIIETTPFTRDNGLLSGIEKLLRPALKKKYGSELEALYDYINHSQQTELIALRDARDSAAVIDIVMRSVAVSLGLALSEIHPEMNFTDIGGDSLSALNFSQLLTDIFQINIPVSVIIGPVSTMNSIATYIERNLQGDTRPSVASIHGENSTDIYAKDIQLEKFIPSTVLNQADQLHYQPGAIHTVLLTGANGYLGRFLCLEWMEKLAKTGGKVICLARGQDAIAARQRIFEAIGNTDEELAERFRQLAQQHLEVIPGDLTQPQCGLDTATWNMLAERVDHIMHCGALVNHVLPYAHMFDANTLGTAELVQLALTTKFKSITYLSTVSVVDYPGCPPIPENADIRSANPQRSINDDYANGYANSKWAGEVLLREAYDRYQIPVIVCRSDMILAHRYYKGQFNVTDAFTRLLLSLALTHIAPATFYQQNYPGESSHAHYDGIPVDFTAAAITAISMSERSGFHTYNSFNPHDDGISLDTFVDWMIEAGIEITKIDDYQQWYERFVQALQTLPEVHKNASLLPLIHAYRQPLPIVSTSPVSAKEFQTIVHKEKIAGADDIPHINAALITKYLQDLRLLGMLT